MTKNIAILGSTGSIGKNLLEIVSKNKKQFKIILLTANNNYKELLKQARIFKVKNLIISNPEIFKLLINNKEKNNYNIYNNFNSFSKIFTKKIDYVMSSISGLDGLIPTLKIIKHTKKITIANKEAIVCGWNLIQNELKKNKTKFIPVDSEHYSIWFALKDSSSSIEKIYLTASGGALIRIPKNKLNKLSINKILKHPTWLMGKKITVDSATLMNKVFEVIEAKNIFDIPYKKISIIIHPSSYVHAIVKFSNGMIKIIAHETTMKIPIGNTLLDNYNLKKNDEINLTKLNNLELKSVDLLKYPLIKLINYLPNQISLFETVLVTINDNLVDLFLNKKINFNDIQKKMIKLIMNKNFNKFKKIKPKNVQDIVKLNKYIKDIIHKKYI